MTLTFDLGGHRDCRSCANFVQYGPHGSDIPCDLVILTFNLGGHGARKIWHMLRVFVSRPVALIFDLLTLKLVCELHLSHLRRGTFLPNLGTLGLWVLELFAMYATDEQTDGRTYGRTDKSNANCPLSYGRGITIYFGVFLVFAARCCADFQNSFIYEKKQISNETRMLLPPYLQYVAALPCESQKFEFVVMSKNSLKIVSHLTKTKVSLVIWLNVVTIVARSVRVLPAHNARTRRRHSSIALLIMVWSMPYQTCRKRCFSSQHLFI